MKKGQEGLLLIKDERKAHPEHTAVMMVTADVKRTLGINYLSAASMNKIIEVITIAINEMSFDISKLGDYALLTNISLDIVNNDFSKDSKICINEVVADLKGAFGGNVPSNWFRLVKTISVNIGGRGSQHYDEIIKNLVARF